MHSDLFEFYYISGDSFIYVYSNFKDEENLGILMLTVQKNNKV